MRRDARKYLWDARDAAESILGFTKEKTFEDYLSNLMLKSAVERQFTIIGEALVRLERTEPDVALRIPDLRQIIGFRNVIVHGYDSLDHQAIWNVIQDKLSSFHDVVSSLMESGD
jgi:uncharacterized protein with HEPN domain